jgi:imidazolonepropionase-like amidohydrolase
MTPVKSKPVERRRIVPGVFLLILACQTAGGAEPGRTLIKNARIYTLGEMNVLDPGMILVAGGKIEGIGPNLEAPADCAVIDLAGRTIIPGLVCPSASLFLRPKDARNLGEESPDADILDGIDLFGPPAESLVRNGVTAVHIGFRSYQAVGGLGAIVKLKGNGRTPFEVIRPRASLRLRLERLQDRKTSNVRRLVQFEAIRRLFIDALEYRKARLAYENRPKDAPKDDKAPEPPAPDEAKEVLLQVLDGKIPLRLEAHRPDAVLNALRLGEELGIDVTLEGCESWPDVLPGLPKAPTRLLSNPLADYGRFLVPGGAKGYAAGHLKVGAEALFYAEDAGSFHEAPAAENFRGLRDRGTVFALTPPDDLLLSAGSMRTCAALLMSRGVPEIEALKAITIDAARTLGVDRRLGSLEIGKDADFVVLDGPPLNTLSTIEKVYIGGVVAWERTQ